MVPGGLKSVDADEILGYKNAENLKTVVFEEGVEEIRSSSFYGFEKLEQIAKMNFKNVEKIKNPLEKLF